jgi:carbamoyltransferase
MKILGISALYHDSAAALVEDGRIIAAAQEERFTRKKHDASFPVNAVTYCLSESKINLNLNDIDRVIFYDKPFLKFERLLETYLAYAPKGFKSFSMAIPIWLREKLFQKDLIRKKLEESFGEFDWINKLLFCEHHLSHAASAYFPSPFDEAVILTMDGVGEWATTSMAIGKGNDIKIQQEIHFPHSIGLLYSAFTYYLGFKVNSGEYKVMGLAPYGEPEFVDKIYANLIDVKEDGSFRLDQSYFNYAVGLTMTNSKFDDLFGGPPRKSEESLEQRHMNLAASIQKVTEDIVLRITRNLAAQTGISNLCLAGGVALNCVANGKIKRDKSFKNIWIQPASGDAGGALGAALSGYYLFGKQQRMHMKKNEKDHMQGSYLGPQYNNEDIEKRLTDVGAIFERLNHDEVIDKTATALSRDMTVGWFQGRMEYGPRALGGRSILGNPRSEKMQKVLNLKIKYRESFRPFAPSILRDNVNEWFELDDDSPYMLLVDHIKQNRRFKMSDSEEKLFGIDKLNVVRSEIPAVTHVDYTARIQTVHEDTNPFYYSLISKFNDKTGCPILINTSFNVRGEPIVCTPEDAFNCLMGTEMDLLSIGEFLVWKKDQNPSLIKNYKDKFELD